jgi:hypothetical protein
VPPRDKTRASLRLVTLGSDGDSLFLVGHNEVRKWRGAVSSRWRGVSINRSRGREDVRPGGGESDTLARSVVQGTTFARAIAAGGPRADRRGPFFSEARSHSNSLLRARIRGFEVVVLLLIAVGPLPKLDRAPTHIRGFEVVVLSGLLISIRQRVVPTACTSTKRRARTKRARCSGHQREPCRLVPVVRAFIRARMSRSS